MKDQLKSERRARTGRRGRRPAALTTARVQVQQLHQLLQEIERLWERRLVRIGVSAVALGLAHWLGIDTSIARQVLGL